MLNNSCFAALLELITIIYNTHTAWPHLRAYWHNPSQAESHHAIILLNLPQFSANGMVFQMLFNVKVKLFWRGETRK